MLRFAVRSLVARRRRAVMTALAVLLGVAMISGTFVFTDTIHAAFDDLFSSASKGADAVVTSRQDLGSPTAAPASIPDSLITRIRRLRGVAAAAGQIGDTATIIGRDGKVIQNIGAPTIALSYLPPPFQGFTFSRGRAPRRADEVALDAETAAREGYGVGDRVPIVTGEPVRRFRISGLVGLGKASLGGATFVVFSLGAARRLYGKTGKIDTIYVAATKGTSPAAMVDEIRPLLSPELVVRTAKGQVDEDVKRVGSALRILTVGLLVFGFIAVLVGAFVIFNTFSITVAQRAREFALLRALGATGVQVLRSVMAEAVTLGVLASVAGLALGLLAAAGIRAMLKAAAIDFPSTALVFAPRTAIVGLLVGVLVTLAAGLVPALRATRVAPLAALRANVGTPATGRVARELTSLVIVTLAVIGLVLVFAGSGSAQQRLGTTVAGAIALVTAIVIISPRAVGRLAGLIGWPLERRGRILGRLARENAARNASRTAVTASSLMIGLALVLFVTIYASGLRSSSTRIIKHTFLGDFTVENKDGITPIPAASARAIAVVPDVLAVSSLKTANATLGNAGGVSASGIDPATIGQVYRFEWVDGSDAALSDLAPGDAIVERDTARAAQLRVGDRVQMTTETGLRALLTVRGIYRDQALLRGFALSRSAFDRLFHQPRLQEVFVKLAPGADRAAASAALEQALVSFPGVVARSEKQLEDEVAGRVNSILVLFYALLAMSVLVSLLGIVNTLTLSVHERTRELGVLRAVGMTARQSRVLVRDESVITAAMGTAVGVLVGVFLAWIVTRALSDEGLLFTVPWAQLLAVIGVGLVAGVVAAIPPARRAARLDVLAAIADD